MPEHNSVSHANIDQSTDPSQRAKQCVLATSKRDELVFLTARFSFLGSTFFHLDSTFWLDSTLKLYYDVLCAVFGCGDVMADERRMRVTRTGDKLHVECLDSHVVHTLVCRQTDWVGNFNCSTSPDTGSYHIYATDMLDNR